MGRTWSKEERQNKKFKKSFVKFKEERKGKHHFAPIVKKDKSRDKDEG